MQETTEKYLRVSDMFEATMNNITCALDGVAKAFAENGLMGAEDNKDLALLKQAFRDELGIVIEKTGLALEKMVDPWVLEAAIAWHTSVAATALRSIQPQLRAYTQSLDEEYARRIQARMAEIAGEEKKP
jgi:hypothetical protein